MSQTVTTVLQIINKILVRLRESEVGTVDETDYSATLLRLINDSKREVEDSFDWVALQNTITVNTAASTHTYDVENAGAGTYTNQRSRLLDVYNTTTDVLSSVPEIFLGNEYVYHGGVFFEDVIYGRLLFINNEWYIKEFGMEPNLKNYERI